MMYSKNKLNKGFTLIEIMVSLSVFIVVMTTSLGAILSILDANEKSQTKKTAMDNLNFALESVSRTIRFGTNFYCGTIATNPPPANDCPSSSSSFTLRTAEGALVTYSLSGGRIMKALNNGTANPVTSPEVSITRMNFYVFGSGVWPDLAQPRVLIIISGVAGTKADTSSAFNLQTMVSQRKLDI